MPAWSRRLASIWLSMANTSGSTLTRPSTSACWATHRSPIRLSGEAPKSPDMRSALSMPNFHGLTAFMVTSSVAARFFGPQVGRYWRDSRRHQRIPHRSRRTSQCHRALAIPAEEEASRGSASTGVMTAAWWPVRYPAPAAKIAPTDPMGPTAWWTFRTSRPINSMREASTAGACMQHRPLRSARPDSARRPCTVPRWYPYPPPAPKNDDHNPPRIQPRNLFDIAVGHDNIFRTDKYKWSARLAVVNLTNKEALYNFLSTFSGTHYVSPRAITATIGLHF